MDFIGLCNSASVFECKIS